MTSRRKISFQLYAGAQAGAMRGPAIFTSGGVVYVAKAGDAQKQAITDKNGTALANPLALTQGGAEFYVLDTITSVDLYIMTPGGHFLNVNSVDESMADIAVNIRERRQLAIIPFSIADTTANTETDTGFDLPALCYVLDRLHGMGVRVSTLDASQNVLFGLLSTESGGDADGLCTNVSLTTAVQKLGVNGALFSSNAPHLSDSVTAKSISYTLDTSTDTGEGFLLIPYQLTNAGV